MGRAAPAVNAAAGSRQQEAGSSRASQLATAPSTLLPSAVSCCLVHAAVRCTAAAAAAALQLQSSRDGFLQQLTAPSSMQLVAPQMTLDEVDAGSPSQCLDALTPLTGP